MRNQIKYMNNDYKIVTRTNFNQTQKKRKTGVQLIAHRLPLIIN